MKFGISLNIWLMILGSMKMLETPLVIPFSALLWCIWLLFFF